MIGTASLRFTMPVSLAPYPTPPVPFPTPPPPANGAQRQLVCSGCRNLLLYPVGPTSVCCAVCNAVTPVPPPGTEMAQLVCGGCHTLLMYIRGATSVQCSCCHTVNLALEVMASLAQKKIFKCFRNTIKYRLLPLLEGNKKLIFMRQRIR